MVTIERPESLLNEHDVANFVGMSLASVRRWRRVGEGPAFLKLNTAVRYRREDLVAWLASRRKATAQQC
jgi:predicted DNA-binding transcriptional regulator AlpA